MKKYIPGLVVVLLTLIVAGYKPVKNIIEEKPVTRNISFSIYKGNNYTSRVYDCTYVQLHLIVEKVGGTKRIVVWDTTFDKKLLKRYPKIDKALMQQISVLNVFDRKEQVEINYVLTYTSNGSMLQMQNGTVVPRTPFNFDIEI